MKCRRLCCCCNCCCCCSSCCRSRDKDCKDPGSRPELLPPYTSVYFRRRIRKLSRPKRMLMEMKLEKFKADFEKDSSPHTFEIANHALRASEEASERLYSGRDSGEGVKKRGWTSWPFIGTNRTVARIQRKVFGPSTDIDFVLKKKEVRDLFHMS
ncbi:hypothetical protein ElyMa_000464200 [Elysia marginata]|uniref:Uncharacterized protein n=1 Tax=Elysia marginata TaxID=1093978 RepID=A0AAV4FU29_9GAST|nr:hypothetical protein ElyMa_000464200 [Elysia marginata]